MLKFKQIIQLSLIFLVVGCQESDKKQNITIVDVNASYPEKKINVQDFAKIEYVPLETTDSFITQGFIQDIGEKYIIAKNYIRDGNIFIFDRTTGKGLKVINHLGQSGEEYTDLTNIVLSESSFELFVSDYPARKILVYDLNGKFKRSFPFTDESYYTDLANYDADKLWAFKGYSPNIENENSCHILISKLNGKVAKEIKIPIDKIETVVWSKDGATITPGFLSTIANADYWGIARMSSDTIYHYAENGQLSPIVTRIPSVHSMDVKKFLYLTAETDSYYFLRSLEKDFDLKKMKGFEQQDYMIDKRDNNLFIPVVLNGDFTNERRIDIGVHKILSDKNVFAYQVIEAAELVESKENEGLKGKLKSVAMTLNDESNPVVMILKNK